MTNHSPRLSPFAALVLAIVTVLLPLSAQAVDSRAQQIFELTNRDRQNHGLPPLRWSGTLAAAAQAHAAWMVREPALSHQYPGEAGLAGRAAQAGAHFQAVAENIALGPSPVGIENQWMHSPPHRANILDPRMTALGVAVVERGGSLYAVEDFAEASEVMGPGQVEQRVGELLRRLDVDPSGPRRPAVQACELDRGMPPETHARSLVRFETPDLSRLPDQVAEQVRRGGFTRASVGACAPRGNQVNFTMYRVAILFY